MGMTDPGLDFAGRQKLTGQKMLGFVVANDDSKHPDGRKLQRVKIRVPVLDRNTPDEDLPWVIQQAAPDAGGNAGDGMGRVNVPSVNSKLWVHFESEDPHSRFYSTAPATDDVMDGNELLNNDYPHTYGSIDQTGTMIAMNTAENTRSVTHVSGANDTTMGDGSRVVYSPGNIYLVAEGEIIFAAKKGIKQHSEGETSVKGSKVKINSGDPAADQATVDKRNRPKPSSRAGQTTR